MSTSWGSPGRPRRSNVSGGGALAYTAAAVFDRAMVDALAIPTPPGPVTHTHVERTEPERPHQAERRRWQNYRGLRGRCAVCPRDAVPKRRDGRLWAHLDPRTEAQCPGGSR